MGQFVKSLLLCGAILLAAPVQAQTTTPQITHDVLLALGIDDLILVMRREGLTEGAELSKGIFSPGSKGAVGWQRKLDKIYDAERMEATMTQRFSDELGATDMTPILLFLNSARGRRLVALELSARQAMTDLDVEDAARAGYQSLRNTGDPRLALLENFVTSNELVEANVAGALNSKYAYYQGLRQAGALPISDRQIISEVWSSEAETQSDITEWIYGFLLMAYGPLDENVVAEYFALSQTPAGRRMNTALFAGFDDMFREISFALGLAMGRILQSQEL